MVLLLLGMGPLLLGMVLLLLGMVLLLLVEVPLVPHDQATLACSTSLYDSIPGQSTCIP